MAYNKKAHLRQNIDAIKIAFALEKEKRLPTGDETMALYKYSGFGGLKEVIDTKPMERDNLDPQSMTGMFAELHQVLKENTADEKEYKRYFDGIKNSILTAYYTPDIIPHTIAQQIKRMGISAERILDPSAGTGVFGHNQHIFNPEAEITFFEKEPVTGLILKYLRPKTNVRIQGFETIEPKYSGYYDLATSNIPFGDVGLFDPAFSTSTDATRRQGARSLHNYFFMKSVDMVRDGGVIAFITSQGVLDSEKNKPVREWLAERCNLVSAIRLPKNLFTDHAGTEVGSDLIILQKRPPGEYALTKREQDFIETRKLSNGISVNNLFHQFDRVIHTDAKVGTNPYGKPAMEFIHSRGVEGIAEDLRKMLSDDLYKHLNLDHYAWHAHDAHEQFKETNQNSQSNDLNPLWQSEELNPFWEAVEEHFDNLTQEERAKKTIQPDINTPESKQEPSNIQQSVIEQHPDYLDRDWKATPEDWQRFNEWADGQEAVRKAKAEGFNLDLDTGELTPLATMEPSLENRPTEINRDEPTPDDLADFGLWAAERQNRQFEEQPPIPEDYAITEPTEEAPKQATVEPAATIPAGEFRGTLFDMDDPDILLQPKPAEPTLNVQQEPLITLYDLFGFSAEERSQLNRPRRRRKTSKKKADFQQTVLDWREELIINSQQEKEERERQAKQTPPDNSRPVYPVDNARLEEQRWRQEQIERQDKIRADREEKEREEYFKPVPFKAEILPHYREGSLVSDEHNRIGYLKNIDGLQPMFHPLELSETQETKASIYVEIRDTYYHLYQNEADRLEANPALREMLNRLYDNYTDRFGRLNDKKNLDLIKMDARGQEILSLERYIDGVAQKADIFHHPVAFNPNEITKAADAKEALVASLNKYAGVNLEYMAGLTGGTSDSIQEELKGSIYFNPEIDGYEIADKYIAGNVIEKADRVERFLNDNPGHAAAEDSLRALREATPKPIAFDDLDFNFGYV